jgi:hypothetical protein
VIITSTPEAIRKISDFASSGFFKNDNIGPRCDDSNMIMGVERKWAPTMMKLEEDDKTSASRKIIGVNFMKQLRP